MKKVEVEEEDVTLVYNVPNTKALRKEILSGEMSPQDTSNLYDVRKIPRKFREISLNIPRK
jgi:hypothetical protein